MKRSALTICIFLFLLAATMPQTPIHAGTSLQTNPCAKAPAPHLKTGISVQITKPSSKSFPGAFLKASPGHTGPVVRYLAVGTVVDVTDGPRCGDDKGYWWRIKLGDLAGWMAEVPVAGGGFGLEPATAPAAAAPLPSTVARALTCVQPITPPAGTPPATEAAASEKLERFAFATLDGNVQISDNQGSIRTLATFDPPPLSVDVSPDGSAVLVVNYNGLYWINAVTGNMVMLADATTLNLQEGSWPSSITWLGDSRNAALEITTLSENVPTFNLWSVAADGSHPPFQIDTGSLGRSSVRRSPLGNSTVILSSNDINRFPKDLNDNSDPLLDYIPKAADSDPTGFVLPAITWSADGKGFYTYIPVSESSGPDDKVGGHLWYVGVDGTQKDYGKLPKIKAADYVIPSGDGLAILVGRGATWAIQNPKTAAILQTLPAVQNLFTWTPDNKGVIYTDRTGATKYLGIDGSTQSAYTPPVNDLYEIEWLSDGTMVYIVRGKDGKLNLSIKRNGEDPRFMGLTPSVGDFGGWALVEAGVALTPGQCK